MLLAMGKNTVPTVKLYILWELENFIAPVNTKFSYYSCEQ